MGVRWLLALTLLGAGEAAGRENEPENAAVTALTKLGAKIQRNSEAPGKPVVAVDLSLTQVTDADLKQLKSLANLQSLNLIGTQISDAGLEHLKGLANLQSLLLQASQVTDTGLGYLKVLPLSLIHI